MHHFAAEARAGALTAHVEHRSDSRALSQCGYCQRAFHGAAPMQASTVLAGTGTPAVPVTHPSLRQGCGQPEVATCGRDGCVRVWDVRRADAAVAAFEAASADQARTEVLCMQQPTSA